MYADALDRLVALYSSTLNSYGMDNIPTFFTESQLPASLILPADSYFESIKPLDISHTYAQLRIYINHLLLIAPAGVGVIENRYSQVATWLDTYASVLMTDPYLDDNLLYPVHVDAVQQDTILYNGSAYVGLNLRHNWVFRV